MELRPIKTKRDYEAALKEAEKLWDAPAASKQADRLEVLVLLIQAYEARHYPIPDPDPIDFLDHVMEARGLARKDLEPHEREAWLNENPKALTSVRRGLDEARKGKLTKPSPDLKAAAKLSRQLED